MRLGAAFDPSPEDPLAEFQKLIAQQAELVGRLVAAIEMLVKGDQEDAKETESDGGSDD